MIVVRMRVMAALLALAIPLAALTGGCGRPDSTNSESGDREAVAHIGSTTMLPLAEAWQKSFNRKHPESMHRPEVDISVSGGGSGTGIRALIAGTADIANSSRDIKEKEIAQAREAGVTPVEHVVAYDGIAVISHPSNPLDEISVDQLSDIFSGRVTTWAELGATGMGDTQVVSRDSASGTYEAFKELVVTMGGRDNTRDYAAAVLKQPSNQAVLALVARTKSAIGYVGLGYLDESVKVLPVIPLSMHGPLDGGEAVAPTVENVASGDYSVSRALYCYTNGEPRGATKAYLDWIEGPEGQAIVEELGFVPVK